MKPLRILHLSSEKSWRGGEQQIAYLLQYSKAQGIELAVLVRKGTPMANWCKEHGIEYQEAGFKNGMDFITARKIKSYAKKFSADFVHIHSGRAHSIAYMAVKLGMKTPLIVHRRVDFPLKAGGPSLSKYNHPSVKAIICVSDAIKKMVQERISNPERARTVYSGIDFSRFSYPLNKTGSLHKEFKIPSNRKLVANISALAPHKDYPTFLRTVEQYTAKHDDCHFLIVGDGDLKPELEQMAEALKLTDHVTFTGFRKDVPEIFQELDIFLITSETEGLGTTVIDALFHGLPVVATKGGGIPELVHDGIEGYLCGVKDSMALSVALANITQNDTVRQNMCNNAHKRALNFSSDSMGAGVLKIYDEVNEA